MILFEALDSGCNIDFMKLVIHTTDYPIHETGVIKLSSNIEISEREQDDIGIVDEGESATSQSTNTNMSVGMHINFPHIHRFDGSFGSVNAASPFHMFCTSTTAVSWNTIKEMGKKYTYLIPVGPFLGALKKAVSEQYPNDDYNVCAGQVVYGERGGLEPDDFFIKRPHPLFVRQAEFRFLAYSEREWEDHGMMSEFEIERENERHKGKEIFEHRRDGLLLNIPNADRLFLDFYEMTNMRRP